MSYITPDRVLEGSTTTGTGDFTLAGNVIGFRAFNAVCAIGDLLPYYIEAVGQTGVPSGEYEVGLGRYKAANVLERVTVKASSNAGALVNFAAGQKIVGIGVPGWDAMTKSSRVGELVFVFGTTPKAGTLEANGAAISRTTYANLWAYAQTSGLLAVSAGDKTSNPAKFGLGDGSTTFELPNITDRAAIARGTSFAIGSTGGSKDAVVVAHTHGITDPGHDHDVDLGLDVASGTGFQKLLPGSGYTKSTNSATTGITINSTGVTGTNANMQPYAALLACIYY